MKRLSIAFVLLILILSGHVTFADDQEDCDQLALDIAAIKTSVPGGVVYERTRAETMETLAIAQRDVADTARLNSIEPSSGDIFYDDGETFLADGQNQYGIAMSAEGAGETHESNGLASYSSADYFVAKAQLQLAYDKLNEAAETYSSSYDDRGEALSQFVSAESSYNGT